MTVNIFKLSLIVLFVFLSSCKNKAQTVVVIDATNVEFVEPINTITYNKIKNSSNMNWNASHLGGINKRQGIIRFKEGNVIVNNGVITNANIVIDMNTLWINNMEKEDARELAEHLKSSDFFDIDSYPTSSFELTNIETTTGDYNFKVTGDLTILGVTKSIKFRTSINLAPNLVTILSEDFIINRSDWGLKYNAVGTLNVPLDYLIEDDIGFKINLTISR